MRRVITPEGAAKVGQVVMTPTGELLEIVAIIGAHELIAGLSEQQRLDRTPNFLRDSIAARCAMWGSTSGREKRNQERAKAKLAKRKAVTCSIP